MINRRVQCYQLIEIAKNHRKRDLHYNLRFLQFESKKSLCHPHGKSLFLFFGFGTGKPSGSWKQHGNFQQNYSKIKKYLFSGKMNSGNTQTETRADLAGKDGVGEGDTNMKERSIFKGTAPPDSPGTGKKIIRTTGRYEKLYSGIHRQGTRTLKTDAPRTEIHGACAVINRIFQGILGQQFGKTERKSRRNPIMTAPVSRRDVPGGNRTTGFNQGFDKLRAGGVITRQTVGGYMFADRQKQTISAQHTVPARGRPVRANRLACCIVPDRCHSRSFPLMRDDFVQTEKNAFLFLDFFSQSSSLNAKTTPTWSNIGISRT